MVDATFPVAGARTHSRSAAQLTGLAGIGFASIVMVQNLVFSSGAPLGNASIADIAAYYQDNNGRLSIATGLVMVNLPLLACFVSGFYARLRENAAASTRWPIMAIIGAALLSVTFGLATATQAVLIANADVLEEQPLLTQFIWDLHSSIFAINLAMLGVLLGAVARAAHIADLTPTWQNWLGYVSAVLLIASSTTAVLIIDGSLTALLGLVGFIGWLVWLATTSVRFLREQAA